MTQSERRAELLPGERYGDVRQVAATTDCPRPALVYLAGHANAYEVRAGRTLAGPVLLDLRVVPLEDGGQITADDLHSIPVRRLVAAAVAADLVAPSDDEVPSDEATPLDWSRFIRPEQPERRRAGRPPAHGPEHYAQVAAVARQARASGASARRQIAERWSVGQTTADKWMSQARELGLLELYQRPSGAPTGQDGGGVEP